MTAASVPTWEPAGGLTATRSLARVAANRALGSLVWLTLEVTGWPGARPGQFALLQAQDSRCFLGRALSVSWEEKGSVSFLIAPVGGGTRELCALRPGEPVWVLGPLGNGFDLEALTAGAARVVIVAGGVGAAPFPLLLRRLGAVDAGGRSAVRAAGRPLEVLILLGFRDDAQAEGRWPLLDAAADAEKGRSVACSAKIVTEDGSLGGAEKVTDALRRELRPGDRLAVCGPWAMSEAVARISSAVPDVEAWFSLEAGMACGVGSCHGCVVPLADGTTARVCREGPVFPSHALFRLGAGPAGGAS